MRRDRPQTALSVGHRTSIGKRSGRRAEASHMGTTEASLYFAATLFETIVALFSVFSEPSLKTIGLKQSVSKYIRNMPKHVIPAIRKRPNIQIMNPSRMDCTLKMNISR